MKHFLTLIFLFALLPLQAALQEVTYTVTSKTSVLAEGNEPIGSMVTFEQTGTGQKGQMTAGNSTIFTLTGLQGLYLHKVTLQMRSNSTAGAGMLQMNVGEDVVWQINESSFAAEQWNGSFTTAFVPIVWDYTKGYVCHLTNNILQIQITATENSLYVASYTVTYSTEAPAPYTVQFHTGSNESVVPITENGVGEGIILPVCQSVDSIWHFMGWTEKTVLSANDKKQLPQIYTTGERFYPTADLMLYALYTNASPEVNIWTQDTLFEDGYYLWVDSLWNVMPYGEVNSKGRITVSDIQITDFNNDGYAIYPKTSYTKESVYFTDFLPDSMVLIQHAATNHYVGYPRTLNGTLTKDSVAWNYRVTEGKEIVFYHDFGNNDWVQLRAKPDNTGTVFYQSYKTTYTKSANLLFNIADCSAEEQIATYTSYPLGTDLHIPFPTSIRITHYGVDNPHALSLSLCTISGQKVLTTNSNISFSHLPQGIYILQADKSFKRISIY